MPLQSCFELKTETIAFICEDTSLSCFHLSCGNINTIQTVMFMVFILAMAKSRKLSEVTVKMDNSNIHRISHVFKLKIKHFSPQKLIECIKIPPN